MTRWTSPSKTRRAAARCILRPLAFGAAVALGAGLWPVAAREASAAGQSVFTSRAKFRIPFQFDAEEMARLGAVEIRLFVSIDHGRHWRHAQSVAPVEGKFTFEAPEEGEYWFAVRTVDAQGQLHPPGPPQPGLQVVVDQTAPQLEIRLREIRPREVELTWQASDPHLDLGSLRMEFLDPGAAQWQLVNITPVESGRTTWMLPNSGRVLVRATVADKAGNTATADATTGEAPAQPAGQPRPAKPDFSQPVAGSQPSSGAEESLSRDESPQVIPNRGLPFPAIVPRAVSGPAEPPLIAESPEPFSARFADRSQPGTPSEITVRHVRSRAFSFHYELQDVGPSGISSVDLYITENDGQKWYYYGPDEDCRSPIAIEVPEDGTYGFALRVRSGVGLVQDPPQPGERPTIVVVVDRQPPRVELGQVTQGQGNSRGEVSAEWSVSDDHLAELPVRLSWAPAREGPWQAVTDWMTNTGRHTWKIDEQSVAAIFLRLEARDAAGNISRAESSAPLVLDLSQPTARITDIEPAQQNEPQ